jgi:hypothetical protein
VYSNECRYQFPIVRILLTSLNPRSTRFLSVPQKRLVDQAVNFDRVADHDRYRGMNRHESTKVLVKS